jgi:hypothetical protein
MSRLELRACRALSNALVWGPMFLLCTLLAPLAQAGSARGHGNIPQTFNVVACYQLVRHEGRMIAWARWEENFSLEKTRSGQFGEDTPPWIVDTVQAWITDAYTWSATDDQIRQWAEELGNTDNLPSASRLSVHETIAIWMRRIGHSCDRQAQTSASVQEPAVVSMGQDAPRH